MLRQVGVAKMVTQGVAEMKIENLVLRWQAVILTIGLKQSPKPMKAVVPLSYLDFDRQAFN